MNLSTALMELPLRQPVAIFLLVLVIILFTPLLLRRLKIPHIIGMILAGMVVGPYGFNILERDASFQIFGQVGILYLMFLAGVEIDMFNLKQNLRKGVLFGLISFTIPMVGGLLLTHYILDTSWLTSTLIASMYASHTLISYPITARFGLTNSRSAVISICGTVVAVLLALVVLAEVVAVQEHGVFQWFRILRLFGLLIVYCGALYYLVPIMTRRFFKSVNEPVTQYIYVMAVMLLASLLAQLIGLEAILGAFLAGLVLNRYIPKRSALMNRIEFVGNAVFIPYFLIGVGMLININVILKGWNVAWIALNMIVVALVCKWLAVYIAQRLYGFDKVERMLMFGLTSGKAAATIAATMVGYQYGLISEDVMNGAVLMILGCCAIASIATERAAMKLRMGLAEEKLKHETGSKRSNARQLVAVANPLTAEGIMKIAIYMRHPKNKLPLTALYVRNNDDPANIAMGKNALQTAVKVASAVDVKVDDVERYDINIATGLVNVLKEKNCTDIIIGLHRKSNIVDTFYGSMIEQLLRATNKSIIMSRCFIPVNTVTRIVVVVPPKAEFETGFRQWVTRIGNLATQVGCKAIFIAYKETIPYIQGVLTAEKYTISHEYREMETWDDFIMLSNRIHDDDLLVVIGARRTSISFSSDMEAMPTFLSRYFANHNIMIIYPEQFGAEAEMPTPIDPLSATITSNPSPLLLSVNRWRAQFSDYRKRRSSRRNRIDI
ncbi:MAG: cation:proton antiporter [Muribaculaceae bacterium]|nr:cation:proton antiporter [Muribaculaceae bacterium]MBQ2371433.1 cation:proton antiporter [Muribaculaceae bacterium]